MNAQGKKLSKRNAVVSIMSYRDLGYMPETMLTFLVRLGWAYGDQEQFTVDKAEYLSVFKVFDKADTGEISITQVNEYI